MQSCYDPCQIRKVHHFPASITTSSHSSNVCYIVLSLACHPPLTSDQSRTKYKSPAFCSPQSVLSGGWWHNPKSSLMSECHNVKLKPVPQFSSEKVQTGSVPSSSSLLNSLHSVSCVMFSAAWHWSWHVFVITRNWTWARSELSS